MKILSKYLMLVACILLFITNLHGGSITLKISKTYLNFPVSHSQERNLMTFEIAGQSALSVEIRLAPDEPDYWVFKDVSAFKGKTLKITYTGNDKGLSNLYQSDEPAGHDSLYREKNRPQFHFTTRRGWINDPNGLLYYEGEYHLFYQHNPYEKEWGNMHWGHAVSEDLIHWKELPDALYPDSLGTVFSGSAVVDYHNTAGFNKGKIPAMIAVYTADNPEKEVQCIAYSLDKGRTFAKYTGNPVIDSKAKWDSKDTRDPKVFHYKPANHWVMVLNERDGHSIYTSHNLKDWKYESHLTGFWECPELFELPVDGNNDNTKWVMYGASGIYMIGSFDGKEFRPESGKLCYTTGTVYAAQTFTNIPADDGRRIQIGWGRVGHRDMPFNGMMLLPTELTLHNTVAGVRLISKPVKEVEQLFEQVAEWRSLTGDEANRLMKKFYNSDCLRIKTKIKLFQSTNAGFNLFGQKIIDYDLSNSTINGRFYSPQNPASLELSADIYIDRTSIEVFIDGGFYSYSMERHPSNDNKEGFHFWGNRIEIKELEVAQLKKKN